MNYSNQSPFDDFSIEDTRFSFDTMPQSFSSNASFVDQIKNVVQEAVEAAVSKAIHGNMKEIISTAIAEALGSSNYLAKQVAAPVNTEVMKTRALLNQTYTAEKIRSLLEDENHHGKRDALKISEAKDLDGKITKLTEKGKIIATGMAYLNLPMSKKEQTEDMEKRYAVTQAAFTTFTMATIIPGHPTIKKWSDLDSDSQKLYCLMAEDFLVNAVGDIALPLYAYYGSWATSSLLGKSIRNLLPRKTTIKINGKGNENEAAVDEVLEDIIENITEDTTEDTTEDVEEEGDRIYEEEEAEKNDADMLTERNIMAAQLAALNAKYEALCKASSKTTKRAERQGRKVVQKRTKL